MGALGNADSRRWTTIGAHQRQPQRRFSSPGDSLSGIRLQRRDSLAARRDRQVPMPWWISARSASSRAIAADHDLLAASAKRSTRSPPVVGDSPCARGSDGVSGVRGVRASGRWSWLRVCSRCRRLIVGSGRRRRRMSRGRSRWGRRGRCRGLRGFGVGRWRIRRTTNERFGHVIGLAGMRIALVLVPSDAAL